MDDVTNYKFLEKLIPYNQIKFWLKYLMQKERRYNNR